MELWKVWTAISAVPTAWRSYVTHYPFDKTEAAISHQNGMGIEDQGKVFLFVEQPTTRRAPKLQPNSL